MLRQTFLSTLDDGSFGYAKAAAYSALLSFFPVLTSAATIWSRPAPEFVSATLDASSTRSSRPAPRTWSSSSSASWANARQVPDRRRTRLPWAASGVIKSLIEGFQAAYRVPRNRDFFHQSVVAMSLVLLSAIPLVCASLLIVFGGQVERIVLNWVKVDPFLNPFAWV